MDKEKIRDYIKTLQSAIIERDVVTNMKGGMKIEQAKIHSESRYKGRFMEDLYDLGLSG